MLFHTVGAQTSAHVRHGRRNTICFFTNDLVYFYFLTHEKEEDTEMSLHFKPHTHKITNLCLVLK